MLLLWCRGNCRVSSERNRRKEAFYVSSLSDYGKEMRHLPVVEWRARSRVPRQSAVLCEGGRFEFDLHGQVERYCFRGNGLPEVDAMGEDMTTKTRKPTAAKSKT